MADINLDPCEFFSTDFNSAENIVYWIDSSGNLLYHKPGQPITGIIDNTFINGIKSYLTASATEEWQIASTSVSSSSYYSSFYRGKFLRNTGLWGPGGISVGYIDGAVIKGGSLSCSWRLDDPYNEFISPIRGILFWYKKDDPDISSIVAWKDIAIGEVFNCNANMVDSARKYTINTNMYLVKINHNTFQSITTGQTIIDNKTNSPMLIGGETMVEPSIFKTYNISGFDSARFTLAMERYRIKKNNSYYSIYIPDGDFFSYYDTNLGSRANDFLSTNLKQNFRTIYNILHNIYLQQKNDNKPIPHYKKRRILKLSQVLSTAPLIDKLTFTLVKENLVQEEDPENGVSKKTLGEYLLEFINEYSVELDSLYFTAAAKIYNAYKKIYNKRLTTDNNINSILQKLIKKYGIQCTFGGSAPEYSIETTNTTEPHINISTNIVYSIQSSLSQAFLSGSNSTGYVDGNGPGHSYYDQIITAGKLQLKTDIKNQDVQFKVSDSNSGMVKAKLIKPIENARFARDLDLFYPMIPTINNLMINRLGGFKINDSTCYIDEKIGAVTEYNGKLDTKPIFLKYQQIIDPSYSTTSGFSVPGKIKMEFKFYNADGSTDTNSIITIDFFKVNHLRWTSSKTGACDSFYREVINRAEASLNFDTTFVPFMAPITQEVASDPGYSRSGFCGKIYLGKYDDDIYSTDVPGVSTKKSPPIKAYGGYDSEVITAIGADIPGHPNYGSVLPKVSSRNPNSDPNIKCFMRSGYDPDGGYDPLTSGTMGASRGIFDPFYGWSYTPNSSGTYVNTFKPNSSTCVFKGIGFVFNNSYNNSSTYTSTININRNASVETISDIEINQQTGTRNYNIRPTKYSRDFFVEDCIPRFVSEDASTVDQLRRRDCGGDYMPYVSYSAQPLKTNQSIVLSTEELDRVLIKDIRVKLNFLNFDNPGNLKITLICNQSPIDESLKPVGAIGNNPNYSDQKINNIIKDINNMNSGQKIVLYNGEYIQNYSDSFSITFSDYASHNYVYSHDLYNKNKDVSDILTFSITNNDYIKPSFKPDGYTDENSYDLQKYIGHDTIIASNNFRSKFANIEIYKGCTFTLKIETSSDFGVDNPSYHSPFDGFLNQSQINNTEKSPIPFNSLCSWELIVDVYDPEKDSTTPRTIEHDIAKYIDLQGNKYPGYNYIIDASNIGSLIPSVNKNAPFNSLDGYNGCVTNKEEINNFGNNRKSFLSNVSAQTIHLANMAILGGSAIAGMVMGGFVAGSLVGVNLFNTISDQAFGAIYTWFASQRRGRLVAAYDDSYYDPDYDRFGYGYPDSALLEITGDGGYTWYTFDVNLFRYDEYSSPVWTNKLIAKYKKDIKKEEYENKEISIDSHITKESFVFNGWIPSKKRNYMLRTSSQNNNVLTGSLSELTDNNILNSIKNGTFNPYNQQPPLMLISYGTKPYQYFNESNNVISFQYHDINTQEMNKEIKNLTINHKYVQYIDEKPCTVFILSDPTNEAELTQISNILNTEKINVIYSDDPDKKRDTKAILFDFKDRPLTLNNYLDLYGYTYSLSNKQLINDSIEGEGSWGSGSSHVIPKRFFLNKPHENIFNFIGLFTEYSGKSTQLKSLEKNKIYAGLNLFFDSEINNWHKHIIENIYVHSMENRNKDMFNKILHSDLRMYISDSKQQISSFKDEEEKGIVEITLNKPIRKNINSEKFKLLQEEKIQELIGLGTLVDEDDPMAEEESLSRLPETYGDKYWFSLDRYQYGVLTNQTGYMILKEVTYSCSQVNVGRTECVNICEHGSARKSNASMDATTDVINVETAGALLNIPASYDDYSVKYINKNAEQQKSEASAITNWKEIFVQRPDIRVSCGSRAKDTVLYIQETYYVPDEPKVISAYDLVDGSSNITVRFKRIPRKIRNIDMVYDKYIIDNMGNINFDGFSSTDGMDLKINPYYWKCIRTDTEDESLAVSSTPNYYKLLNEMIFRAFFGSKDGIEFKDKLLQSKMDFEWIPYEYDLNAKCNDNG